ncbi:DUF2063 domain-containing protein [Siculibacillus lacustris]|uniref:DUF2063 domain-containing protein n=1 Tax=Siculibacillus lacustris TaxID=1549641 RepID=A0A4Q9VT74_9HYPH|nr:DNA-binding domain-containing protein [Siculibacillus lacustris]TBW38759.1 DUF2063 domain-containing protein [Siculibacillus lacustris]
MPPHEIQAAFAAALIDTERPPPEGLIGRDGGPVARRFAVHRAARLAGLIGALEVRHPVVARLVGDAFFTAMAQAFVAAHPPASPLLLAWGDDLPAFLGRFRPSARIPYLADVARLESAWARAHHAAEAVALTPAALDALAPPDRQAATIVAHPSVGLVASDHPVVSIWLAHRRDGDPQPPAAWVGEAALVVRPEAEVRVHRLTPGAHALAAALLAGASVAAATAAAKAADESCDADAALADLVQFGAVTGFTSADPADRRL